MKTPNFIYTDLDMGFMVYVANIAGGEVNDMICMLQITCIGA